MLTIYPAIFHYEDQKYWVEFPDLIGCNTQGDSLESCMSYAQEALGLYLVALIEESKQAPKPSEIKSITASSVDFVSFVSVDLAKYRKNNKAVKKTLSIPKWLSDEAEKSNLSLSKILQEGLKERLGYNS